MRFLWTGATGTWKIVQPELEITQKRFYSSSGTMLKKYARRCHHAFKLDWSPKPFEANKVKVQELLPSRVQKLCLSRQMFPSNLTRSLAMSHPFQPKNSHPCVLFQRTIHSSAMNYCSALFITNEKLSQLCSNVSPTFDIKQALDNEKNILSNLKQRRLDVGAYDFTQFRELYEQFVLVETSITDLEYKLVALEDFLHRNRNKMDASQIESKGEERQALKAEMRKFDDFLLNFQKKVVLKILALPNELLANTPEIVETIYQFNPKESLDSVDDIEKRLEKYVRFENKIDIHYLGPAAKFEYFFPIVIKDYFTLKHKFVPFTNTDLCRGVIVEGCGTPYMCPLDNLVMVNHETDPGEIGYDEFRYHLVGSAHMSMFCAYHTNQSVSSKDLPVKYIASGKRYGFHNLIAEFDTNDNKSKSCGVESLYNSVQKENVALFVGTSTHESLLEELENLRVIFKHLFHSFNLKHRLVRVPASELHVSESSRVEFQLFSPSLNGWVACAEICLNGQYVSRRLNMRHHKAVTRYEKEFLYVLSGSLYVNVLLVNLIEGRRTLDVAYWRNCLVNET